MARRKTQEEFIADCVETHGDTYDYSEAVYKSSKTKVKIICKEHGPFYQRPRCHIKGHGCNNCANVTKANKLKMSYKGIVEKAKIVHKGKYSYPKHQEYKNSHQKIKIICKDHGVFYQATYSHLGGIGCSDCGHITTTKKITKSKKQFIKEAHKKFNGKYIYPSDMVYKNSDTKVRVICPNHGEFFIRPGKHLSKGKVGGCQKCTIERIKENWGWDVKHWELQGKNSDNFTSFKLYIIKLEEGIYKIGITFTTLKLRFSQFPIEYKNPEILDVYSSLDAEKVYNLEKLFHKLCKPFKVLPDKEFNGMHECFSSIDPIIPLLK